MMFGKGGCVCLYHERHCPKLFHRANQTPELSEGNNVDIHGHNNLLNLPHDILLSLASNMFVLV